MCDKRLYGFIDFFLVVAILLAGAATALADNVTVTWDASTDPALMGYKVYYGTASRSYFTSVDVGNLASQTLNLAAGAYYIAVTAYNSSLVESGYSNEVSTTINTCTFAVSPLSTILSAAAGGGSVSVSATAGCAWTAASNVSWIIVNTGASGAGNGTVTYSVAANTTISARTESVTIAGQTVTISQAGIACGYSISSMSQSFTQTAGTGSVSVTATTGCAWTAASNVSWITIGSGASGTGNGTLTYSVAANTTVSSRLGTLTIAGQTVTISQAGIACSYSISPTSQSFTQTAATGSVSVTTTAGCAWTSASNASWITIGSGASGTGNGTLTYSVAANTTISARTGTVTIAGQTVTISQAGIACSYSISPANQSFTQTAATGSVAVTAMAGCAWTAASNASWIIISSGASGTGSGSVTYAVANYKGNKGRTGTMTIAGISFTVTQSRKILIFYSQIMMGDEWSSAIVLTNPSRTEWATGDLKLYDAYGDPVSVSFDSRPASSVVPFAIEPLSSLTLNAAMSEESRMVSARVESDRPIEGMAEYFHPEIGTTRVLESVPVPAFETRASRDVAEGRDTGLILINPGDTDLRVRISLRREDGLEIPGAKTIWMIPARGHLSMFLKQLFPEADTSVVEGWLTARAVEGFVAASAMQFGTKPGEFKTIPLRHIP